MKWFIENHNNHPDDDTYQPKSCSATNLCVICVENTKTTQRLELHGEWVNIKKQKILSV